MKDYDERDGKRVWLSEKEIQTLLTNTDSDRPDIDAALLLASRCGLRRNEIVQVTPGDLERTDHGQVVRIWGGKGEKYREVPVPDELMHIALGINRDQSESLVTCDPSTIYDYVARARARSRADPRRGLEVRRPPRPPTQLGRASPRGRGAPVGRDGVGRLGGLGDLSQSLSRRVLARSAASRAREGFVARGTA